MILSFFSLVLPVDLTNRLMMKTINANMDSRETLIDLVVNQNSPDNHVRADAESSFKNIAAADPSRIAYELMQSTSHESPLPVDVKQSCLLHLRRLVPMFWSMGFQLFVGPPIAQETKAFIRDSLIQLATSSVSSKIRSGSAYVIVQIAAVDFPDEWPDLLDTLYKCAVDRRDSVSVIGSLSVLNDLFDDLISEEQFWEGDVGNRLISYIFYLLEQGEMSTEIKISALKLYLTVLGTLLSAEALELEARKRSVLDHVNSLVKLLLILIQSLIKETSSSQAVHLVHLSLRSHLYQVLAKIIGEFRRYIPEKEIILLVKILSDDLWLASRIYKEALVDVSGLVSLVKLDVMEEAEPIISTHIIDLMEALSVIQASCCLSDALTLEDFERLVMAMSVCCQYPKAVAEDYLADFNVFVTDATGLSSHVSIRDSIQDFLSELNDADSAKMFNILGSAHTKNAESWNIQESVIFLHEGLFTNQESRVLDARSVAPYLAQLVSLILSDAKGAHPLLVARVLLLIPRTLETFGVKGILQDLAPNALRDFFKILSNSSTNDYRDLIWASAMIGVSLWRNIEILDPKLLGNQIQMSILKTCFNLLEDSEEDTLSILLEATLVAISIDTTTACYVEIEAGISVVDLLLRVSFKDPSNVQVMINSPECLQSLLTGVEEESFLQVCQNLVPYLVEVMLSALAQASVEYSSQLYLSIDLLGYIIEASPLSGLPSDVFVFVFPVLKNVILQTNDDQILQGAGEVFNKLMQNNENQFIKFTDSLTKQTGLDILLAVASKFLSPDLSDSAAMNCGLIVMTLFERFQSCLNSDFFFKLLEATVNRVAIASEVITIENLILVFCKLVTSSSPLTLVDALTNMRLKDAAGNMRDGLQTVLPIWFDSFEVTRGAEKIQQNILALGRLYSLGDARLENVKVNGDLIPYDGDLIITRSMAKSMPQKYTQISAPLKIIKLLVSELQFQSLQPNPDDYVIDDNADGDDEDGWEDMDSLGVPNYEKLKSYIDSDEEDSDQTSDKGVRETLLSFFKECVSKNLANFQSYYEMLDEDEKSVITENVIFT